VQGINLPVENSPMSRKYRQQSPDEVREQEIKKLRPRLVPGPWEQAPDPYPLVSKFDIRHSTFDIRRFQFDFLQLRTSNAG